MGMDERKTRILQAIIADYILTAVPVGSRTISKKYDMGLSSATIRNEMSDLEELGYLDQPHVSAGRIPSAKAYRLYVDQLLRSGRLRTGDEQEIRSYFTGRVRQMEEVFDHAAQVLSTLTRYTAVVLSPSGSSLRIRNIQLVPVSADRALLVLVTDSGIVRDNVVDIPRALDADTLYALSRAMTEALSGCTLEEALTRMPTLIGRMRENADVLLAVNSRISEAAERGPRSHVAIGGVSNMLAYPEYADAEKARNFLSLMETRDKLAELMSPHSDVAFTVRIGPETGLKDMSDCSIVTATYSTNNGRQGTIGIIGPTRMQYSRVLSILQVMGSQLSELFSDPDGPERR